VTGCGGGGAAQRTASPPGAAGVRHLCGAPVSPSASAGPRRVPA
jgi:hypothetical protein